MSYFVAIADRAEQDLREIYQYIANTLRAPQNAASQLDRLEENIEALAEMPERYRRYEKEPWNQQGWRIMVVDRYCVFYTVDHSRKTVHITRVLYGSRDIGRVLAEEDSPAE